MSDLSKLLHGAAGGVSFLDRLELRPEERTELETGREAVRRALVTAFAREARDRLGHVVSPRFFVQGSFAYKTLNQPAYPPQQQKDLDYGLYLPLTFIKEATPAQAAKVYFGFVDEVLETLCKQQGWAFDTRPTCARLTLASDAHVDVPMYAIPDVQFATLAKSALARAAMNDQVAFAEDSAIDFMNTRRARLDNWDALPSEEVLLAHREDDWKVSDPRKIHEWFLSAVDRYGEQLRRVSRYLKAWRDQQGTRAAGLSSICLMVCAFEAYRILKGSVEARDDRALLQVARMLPQLLAGPIENPTDPAEKLCARMGSEDRRVAIALAQKLIADLEAALSATQPQAAIAFLRQSLGPRIPDRHELVRLEGAVATVRREPARVVAAPVVGRSISG